MQPNFLVSFLMNNRTAFYRSSLQSCSIKKGVLRNFAKFTGKHLCFQTNFIKKESLAEVFSCEFCEISKNTFLQNTSGRLLPFLLFTVKIKANLKLVYAVYCALLSNISKYMSFEYISKFSLYYIYIQCIHLISVTLL